MDTVKGMRTRKKLTIPLIISVLILICGIVFRIYNLPYSSILFSVANFSVIVLYFIRFISKTNKIFEDYQKLLIVISWSIALVFVFYDFKYSTVFIVLALLIFYLWSVLGLYELLFEKKGDKKKKPLLSKLLGVLSTFFIISGVISSMLYLPYSKVFIFAGLVVLVVWLLSDFVIKKSKQFNDNILDDDY